jgi:penicillin-binding protein 2
MSQNRSRNRLFYFLFILVGVVFIIRLAFLQLVKDEYKIFAETNSLQKRVVIPARGLILDRNNKVLVSNETVYDLFVIPNDLEDFDKNELAEILNLSVEEIDEKLKKAKAYSPYRPSPFLKNVSLETYGILQERIYEFRGFFVQPGTIRYYPNPIAPNIFGYVGEVDSNEIKASEGYYLMSENIGKTGLEKYYEKELRGKKGLRHIVRDKYNRELGSFEGGKYDVKASRGKNLNTTIELELQKYGELLMQNKKGGVVAIEPSTGEVLMMVSSPGFDPSLLVGRKREKNFPKLVLDENKPLYNRSLTWYPPGSTFKIVMALIALSEGVITPQSTYFVNGGYYLPGLTVKDHIVGNVNLHTSIVKSSNAYYCHVFRSVIDQKKFNNVEEGYLNWVDLLHRFGIGHQLGIDLPNEKAGILPTVERYDKIYGKGRWKSSNILSLAIGQAEISLTPLQMANVAAIVANKGYYYDPHLVRSIGVDDSLKVNAVQKHEIGIKQEYYSLVTDAMQEVLLNGTAIRYGRHFDTLHICGKTGTSQNPHGEDHSVFIAFAPKENPKIAIAAIVENSGQGGHWAAPICMLSIEKYLTGTVSEKRKWIEELMLEGDFIHSDDEEEKVLDEEAEDGE